LEQKIVKRCARTGRMFAFLRLHRHELFDDVFQAELTTVYKDSPLGQPPLPPAMLATVTLLQALVGESDAGAVEAAIADRRWQMVLDCLGDEEAPFSQGSLVDFRRRMVAHGMHHRLVEQSVALAKKTGDFGVAQLRVALDSAPLWGAGRVEDTFNLIGHALAVVMTCAAATAGLTVEEVRGRAGLKLLGHSSLKAALDIDWDDPDEQTRALRRLLDEVAALQRWVAEHLASQSKDSPLKEALEQLTRLVDQDVDPEPPDGVARIKQGTAKERQISIRDPQMRHGRKSRSQVIKGFKRFIARELDHGLILAATVQPANQPERDATAALKAQIDRIGTVHELHIDRGFLASNVVEELGGAGAAVVCRPWRTNNRGRFGKDDFALDLDAGRATCPAGHVAPIRSGAARFGKAACGSCPLRAQCTDSKAGRTLHVHLQEELLLKLRAARKTSEGRARLRQRVAVEHGLAHICARQGRAARYVGVDKNVFDLCRYAVIENLFVADRLLRKEAA
jgi:hypothetical protein